MMDLPSFLWLWRIAAWSMGLSLAAYGVLALSGGRLRWLRVRQQDQPSVLRWGHLALGMTFVLLILNLLGVGLIGTLGHYGNLGHSHHLFAGLSVVALTLCSAWSALQIRLNKPWARALHISLNGLMLLALTWVGLSGWGVVQKYLPH